MGSMLKHCIDYVKIPNWLKNSVTDNSPFMIIHWFDWKNSDLDLIEKNSDLDYLRQI